MTPKVPPPTSVSRAAVIGASMAGLLAARVLAEHYAEVVLLERDELPAAAAPRKGTPHAVMAHGLLARGAEVLDELFPGFTDALVAGGAVRGDLQGNVAFEAAHHRMATATCGKRGIAVSRLAIEAELRRRVRALPNVRFVTGVDVVAPVIDAAGERVSGVRYVLREGQAADGTAIGHTLEAALTLDCSGRGSRSASWLRQWGYEAAPEERVEVGLCYVGAHFRREGRMAMGQGLDKAAVIRTATAELAKPGVLIAQEPDASGAPRWVVALGGYAGDHPQPTRASLRERAREMGQVEIATLAGEGELIGDITRYHFPYSLRRRYERLARFPLGYLVMGDAMTSFNPIYGQGMTVATCQALALRAALAAPPQALARRFFKAAAKIVDTPWQLAVGSDLAIPRVPGPRPLSVRLVNAYVARLFRAAAVDTRVALAFLEVMHLLKPPPTLFAPGVMWRVWRRGGVRAAVASAVAAGTHAPGAGTVGVAVR